MVLKYGWSAPSVGLSHLYDSEHREIAKSQVEGGHKSCIALGRGNL